MIGIRHKEVSVLPSSMNLRIGANNQLALSISTGILQVPQTLKSPAVQELVAGTASKNMGTNKNPWQGNRTGVDRTTPVPSGISGTSAAPSSGCLCNPRIKKIWQLTTPNFRKSDELNALVERSSSVGSIALPVISQVFSYQISDSSSRDLYMSFRLNLTTESVNTVVPQLVNHGLSNFNT